MQLIDFIYIYTYIQTTDFYNRHSTDNTNRFPQPQAHYWQQEQQISTTTDTLLATWTINLHNYMHTTGNINIFHNHRHTTGNTNNSSPQLHQRRRERETQREREKEWGREKGREWEKKETKRERETERENERGRKKEKRESERERENGTAEGQKQCCTHVKSCRITLAGLKGISTLASMAGDQPRMFFTSFSSTWKLSQLRTADSNSTRTENGSFSVSDTIEQYNINNNNNKKF